MIFIIIEKDQLQLFEFSVTISDRAWEVKQGNWRDQQTGTRVGREYSSPWNSWHILSLPQHVLEHVERMLLPLSGKNPTSLLPVG